MLRHRTDLVAFGFATVFLVCAGLAVGVRTADLGVGVSAADGAWIAGAVLTVAGVIGVVGTLSGAHRDRRPAHIGHHLVDEHSTHEGATHGGASDENAVEGATREDVLDQGVMDVGPGAEHEPTDTTERMDRP